MTERSSSTSEPTLAFLGAGNMAGALMRGLIASGRVQKNCIVAADVREGHLDELREQFGIRTEPDNQKAARQADVVVLGTKPQTFPKLLTQIGEDVGGKLVISIAAGIPLSILQKKLTGARVIRVMPNTPALVDAGATAVARGDAATDDDVAFAVDLFDAVGMTVVLDESQLDAATGLSGSGPAYIFLIIEALADAGVKVGLHRDSALRLAAQTVLGSAKLLLETGEHPGRLKDMVTSPGGTAIAGLHTLEAGGLRTTLINAVESATLRSKELGAALEAQEKD